MSKAKVISMRPTLDEAVQAIEQKFAEGDSARLAAGKMLLELRVRVMTGEAGEGVKWWPWYESKFTRSRRDDPGAAVEHERRRRPIFSQRGAGRTSLFFPWQIVRRS
jgi:hypothetical protein